MNSLSGNVFQQPQISYIPREHSRKWIQVGFSLHCLTNTTQRGKTALRCIWIHRHLHISTSYCKTLMLSKDKMWTPEQGKGCVYEWTTQCWRRRSSGTQLGALPLGRLLPAGPALAPWTALPSHQQWEHRGRSLLVHVPPVSAWWSLTPVQSLRAPHTMNQSTVSGLPENQFLTLL